MSNPVYIVSKGNDKIVIRFFESSAADFKLAISAASCCGTTTYSAGSQCNDAPF